MHLRSHPKFAQMGWTRISRIRWKSDGVCMRADDVETGPFRFSRAWCVHLWVFLRVGPCASGSPPPRRARPDVGTRGGREGNRRSSFHALFA